MKKARSNSSRDKGFGGDGEAGGRWKPPELSSGSSLIVPVAMDKGLRFRGSPPRFPEHSQSLLRNRRQTTQAQFNALLDRSAKHTKTGHVTLMK